MPITCIAASVSRGFPSGVACPPSLRISLAPALSPSTMPAPVLLCCAPSAYVDASARLLPARLPPLHPKAKRVRVRQLRPRMRCLLPSCVLPALVRAHGRHLQRCQRRFFLHLDLRELARGRRTARLAWVLCSLTSMSGRRPADPLGSCSVWRVGRAGSTAPTPLRSSSTGQL